MFAFNSGSASAGGAGLIAWLRARRYVPFYGTQLWSNLGGGEGRCKPNWTEAAQDKVVADFWADAPALLPTLGSQPHWMQLSEIELVMHRGCGDTWGTTLTCHPLAAHMLFATPEALTEMHRTAWRQRYHGRVPLHRNSLAVPYLGHVHRASMLDRAQAPAAEGAAASKQLLASMSFKFMRRAGLRMNLTEQCNAEPGDCWHIRYRGFMEVLDSFRRAWFCVQPYGDTPTRSALMDCLASGLAVPVVFDEYLFDMLPFADVVNYRSMLAYVAEEDVMPPGGNLLRLLRAVGNETRMAMLLSVQRASHALQYAVRVPSVRHALRGVALSCLHDSFPADGAVHWCGHGTHGVSHALCCSAGLVACAASGRQ